MNKDMVLSLVRHGLTTAGAGLAATHGLDPTDVNALAGAGVTVAAVLWGMWDKKAKKGE